jgi:hypothetical protein
MEHGPCQGPQRKNLILSLSKDAHLFCSKDQPHIGAARRGFDHICVQRFLPSKSYGG